MIQEYDIGVLCLLETHISGDRALGVARRISLDKSFMMHANGQVGGIWCMLNSQLWQLEVMEHSSQYIHLKILKGALSWFCIFVYASPRTQGRVALWGDLRRLAGQINGPWHLMGEFNAVLRQHERVGGSVNACIRGDNAFKDFVNRYHLMDLGYTGAPFTWHRGNVFERLDRSLASYEWRILFPNAALNHLNPLKSDHAPILLRL
ncbi:uncharacterized protein LOC109801423 [Cajanus cajan]|uniref:uncharacterized protein LOC109801423 n=1 Tax=Cajanus cajan TaxID=3821 RepID=UPI00098DC95A|nr:uncharacterized protein LOC109801423 [Cajanus cajan]